MHNHGLADVNRLKMIAALKITTLKTAQTGKWKNMECVVF